MVEGIEQVFMGWDGEGCLLLKPPGVLL